MTGVPEVPVWVGPVTAAGAVGLAWWRFGMGPAGRRRPAAVWLTLFAAAPLAGAGGAIAYLSTRDGLTWLPLIAAGAAGAAVLARRRPAGPAGAPLWAVALLMFAGPFAARARPVAAVDRALEHLVTRQRWHLLGEAPQGLAVAGGAAAILAAAAAETKRRTRGAGHEHAGRDAG